MKRVLPWLVFAACSAPPGGASGPCVADQDVESQLSGKQSCNAALDGGCVVVVNPTCVSGSSAVPGFSAVSADQQAAVEHAFSIIEAEECPPCTAASASSAGFGSGGIGGGGIGGAGGEPSAFCANGTCELMLIATGPGGSSSGGSSSGGSGQGAFEWACYGACDATQYCPIEGLENACPGWPGYYTVGLSSPYSCVPAAGSAFLGEACQFDTECGLNDYCADAGPYGTVCAAGCADPQEPTLCDAGCQLTPGGQGCNICYCDAGCPGPRR